MPDLFAASLPPMPPEDPNVPDMVLDYLSVTINGFPTAVSLKDKNFKQILQKVNQIVASRMVEEFRDQRQPNPGDEPQRIARYERDKLLAEEAERWLAENGS